MGESVLYYVRNDVMQHGQQNTINTNQHSHTLCLLQPSSAPCHVLLLPQSYSTFPFKIPSYFFSFFFYTNGLHNLQALKRQNRSSYFHDTFMAFSNVRVNYVVYEIALMVENNKRLFQQVINYCKNMKNSANYVKK